MFSLNEQGFQNRAWQAQFAPILDRNPVARLPLTLPESQRILNQERGRFCSAERTSIISLLREPQLSAQQVRSLLEFAARNSLPEARAALPEPPLTRLASAVTESPETKRIRSLNLGEGGFIKGPEVDPLALVEYKDCVEFKDILRALQSIGLRCEGVIYPKDRYGTQFIWKIYWQEGFDEQAVVDTQRETPAAKAV